jgi:uracil-DNA glycosylase family 4
MDESGGRNDNLRADLVEHLRFLGEIGVAGFSRSAAWSTRAEDLERQAAAERESLEGRAAPGTEGVDPGVARAPGQRRRSGVAAGSGPADAAARLSEIRAEIGDCKRCKLHRLGRRHIVFGIGNPNAQLMFIGEAPGYDEDLQGEPFVGRAGQLLTRIIEAIGLKREDVYIANVIKCRPPENRNPEPDEVDTCEPFVFEQVEAIRPKVIVALGTFAARALLRTQDPISRLRGRIYTYGHSKLVPTFHPAYLLRSPERKRDTWEDMKKVMALLKEADAEGG